MADTPTDPRPLRATLLACVGLAAIAIVAYRPVLDGAFFNLDDLAYVRDNPYVQHGLTSEDAAWAATALEHGNWHPLTWISLQLDRDLHGPGPAGFHLTNLVLHAANAVLLFLLLQYLTQAFWRSLAVAALFALHPCHVESVAWIAERKDVLSTLLGLLTLLAYAWYTRRPGWWRFIFVVLAFALGLTAKQMLVTLPLVMLLLDAWPLRRWGKVPAGWLLLEKVPLLALAAASGVLTVLAQRRGHLVEPLDALPLGWRVGNALVAYCNYLGKTFWPHPLAVFYPHPRDTLSAIEIIAAAVLLTAITALVVWQRKHRPYLAVGWFWFVGMLVPVIGLVQVGTQAYADRYTYLPHVGLFLMAVWGAAELAKRYEAEPIAAGAAAVTLIACGIMTWVQAGTWRDSETVWRHALSATRDNPVAHMNLANTLMSQDKVAEAREQYAQAVRLQPENPAAHYGLGQTELLLSHVDAAVPHFARAVKLRPDYGSAHYGLGLAYLQQKRPAEAAEQLAEAAWLLPNQASVHFDLGEALARQEKFAEAVPDYRRAVELRPNFAPYHFYLALALRQSGQSAEAEHEYRQGLRLHPGWPREAAAQAWTLATHPNASQRDGPLAVRLSLQALQAGGSRVEFLMPYAAALAEVGRFDDAAAVARQALAQAAGAQPATREVERQLAAYQEKQPYRQPAGR